MWASCLGVALLSINAFAQENAQPANRLTPAVTLVANGTANVGNVVVDFRGLTVLAMTPKAIAFTQLGQSQQLTVQAVLTDRSSFTVNTATYGTAFSINRPTVASVSPSGLVTALSTGTALVMATTLGETVQSIIVVNPSYGPTGLQINPTTISFSEVGAQQQLQVLESVSGGVNIDVTSQSSTTYMSQNPTIASVSPAGLVTAESAGSAIVQATFGGFISTVGVTVTIPPADALTGIALTSPVLVVRSTGPVQLSVVGILASGQQTNLSSSLDGTTYQTSASTVATISSNGAITAVGAGYAQITATNSGFYASTTVRVSFAPLQSVTVTPDNASIPLSAISPVTTQQLRIRAIYADGSFDSLTSSTTGTTYQSSNAAVATVGLSGLVTFTQPGTATITVTNGAISAQTTFTVTQMNPTFLSYFPGSGFTGVAVSSQIAYVTAGTGGLQVIDATNLSGPFLAGSATTTGNMVDVKAWNKRAYVAETSGLAVFNVANEANPVRVTTIPGSNVTGVDVDRGYLYYVDGTTLHVYSTSTLTSVGQVTMPAAGLGVAVSSGVAYVIDAASALDIVSVASPSGPVLVSSISVPGAGSQLTAHDGVAYVPQPTGSGGIQLVDATTPSSPVLAGQAIVGGGTGLYGAAVSNGIMVGAMYAGVGQTPVFNVSNAYSPAYIALMPTGNKHAGYRVAFQNGVAYVVDANVINGASNSSPSPGLYIGAVVPIRNQASPTVSLSAVPLSGASSVVEGGYVVVSATATSGVGIADVLYSVNGVVQSSATTAPNYAALVRIPAGTAGTAAVISAQSQDIDAMLSPVSSTTINVVVDPLTTVQGKLLTSQGAPVANTTITFVDGLQTTTGADGSFLLTHVPTAQGNVVLSATTTISGYTLYANLAYPPVLGGVTSFGNVVLNGNVTFTGNVAGQTLVPLVSPYVISGQAVLPQGQTLTAPAGTIFKFAPAASLTVNGALIANGATGNPVTFTSLQDNSIGGDTGDLGVSYGFPGQYVGLIFQNADPSTLISSSTLRFGQSVQVTAGTATFVSNMISNMSTAPIQLTPGANVAGSGNQSLNNPINGVDILAGGTERNWSLSSFGFPYVIRSGLVSPSGITTLAAGTIVKLYGAGTISSGGELVASGGQLIAQGMPGNPVIFTSLNDNAVGGNTSGSAAPTAPAPGDWPYVKYGSFWVWQKYDFRLKSCDAAWPGVRGLTALGGLVRRRMRSSEVWA